MNRACTTLCLYGRFDPIKLYRIPFYLLNKPLYSKNWDWLFKTKQSLICKWLSWYFVAIFSPYRGTAVGRLVRASGWFCPGGLWNPPPSLHQWTASRCPSLAAPVLLQEQKGHGLKKINTTTNCTSWELCVEARGTSRVFTTSVRPTCLWAPVWVRASRTTIRSSQPLCISRSGPTPGGRKGTSWTRTKSSSLRGGGIALFLAGRWGIWTTSSWRHAPYAPPVKDNWGGNVRK